MMRTITAALAVMLAGGCATSMSASAPTARASLAPTTGNQANGAVTFEPRGDKIRVVAKVGGLTPGAHGFHIHEKGDCSAADGTSAGGHFNPGGQPHGDPAGPAHHAGDMPALVADANGNATLDAVLDGVTIGSGPGDIVGRAVVVHKDPDDFRTQPAGNSGARIACGVIVGL